MLQFSNKKIIIKYYITNYALINYMTQKLMKISNFIYGKNNCLAKWLVWNWMFSFETFFIMAK